jgi:protein transport protein SEC23
MVCSQIDFTNKVWACPFCVGRNAFPPHYAAHINETNLPAELIRQYTTVEYELPGSEAGPPCFLLVVDTTVDAEELDSLKDSLQQSLALMPEDSLVGLITYGKMVQVHELSGTPCPRSYVFRGSKEYRVEELGDMLGIKAGIPTGTSATTAAAGAGGPGGIAKGSERFFRPVSECSMHLDGILESLSVDAWPKREDERPARSTGAAMGIAVGMLSRCLGWRGARIMLFCGGPATHGPGQVVEPSLRVSMRSHEDIVKAREASKFVDGATEYYTQLAKSCVSNGHVVDVFACALDQVGLLEMSPLTSKTGGLVVLADSFGQSVFKESYRRVFSCHEDDAPASDAGFLTMGFAATLEVQTSPEYKVCGAIGSCTSLGKKDSPSVSEQEIGEGGTNAWAMGGIDPSTTIALYFDIVNPDPKPLPPTKRRYIQIVTRYQHASGRFRLRVTTAPGIWCADPSATPALATSFDQEAAAVLMARVGIDRTKTEQPGDILRWLDRSLIRLCAQFASYSVDTPSSFDLGPTFSIFPQFMYHLRRSQFIQPGTYSPDETVYYRSVLLREDVSNSIVMIQPSLISYSFSAPPSPVLLDATSIRPDVILLLDTFFAVVIWHGNTIAQWRDEGYHMRPEHVAFKNLLQAPQDDAQSIMADRFPVPRYIICDQDKSQARFLMAKVNPSVTYTSGSAVPGTGAEVITDEVSFSVFMEALIKMAVQS